MNDFLGDYFLVELMWIRRDEMEAKYDLTGNIVNRYCNVPGVVFAKRIAQSMGARSVLP
jgi:hypothetical protein